MSGSKKDHGPLVVGGEPRIDFLPPETKKRKENRRQRRSLVALVIMVAVVCALGFGFSTTLAASAEATLKEEQTRTANLLAQQRDYAEARSVQTDIATAMNARLAATATEIMWSDYVTELLAGMPEGAQTRGISIDAQSALELTPTTETLLQHPRVATLLLTVDTTDLVVADAVLAYLKTVPAYADAWTSSVAVGPEAGFRMDITLDIDSTAFERRFFVNPPADAATEDEG